ncbi:MAG: Cysteine/O-acetylserine efflux protein [Alphaproteobacteria bacterium MarineAlpha5_Bin9]|nr:MAG: Cysteine/O-acetylserine efflux protein [Alphaproteobacteria bacterium MarineAlpha5_Bin9]|tara:strand:+ start:5165 stop:5764 length:600 start_codon:yes stop_codon:yes gene_type:complete
MITWDLFITISVYYFVMYATPGPNNSILTTSGIKFGFRRTIPNILGIPSGHGLQLGFVCFGLGSLFDQFPIILDIMKYIGSAYLLYLAWKMFGTLQVSESKQESRPLKYYEAILFQFVNPKAWVICITAVSLFFPEKENIILAIVFMVLMSTLINLPSISIWAFGGSIIRNYLKNENVKKITELFLAILLIGTAISILF